MADIVSDFLERLQTLAPDIPQQTRQVLEAQIRHQWGGTEPYVARRPAWMHSIKVAESLRSRKTVSQAIQDAGLKRRNGYYVLNRK